MINQNPLPPMIILAVADFDDFHWKYGSGRADVLLSCGDVDDQVISEAADAFGCRAVFAVKGNHDSPQDFPDPITALHRQIREFDGLKFGGLNGSWKYKPRGHFLYNQQEAAALLDGFPAVDIFLSHNSPRGIHDRDDMVHDGFDGLTAYLNRTGPRLLIHGHQHIDRETVSGRTRVIGVYQWKLFDFGDERK